MSKWTSEWPSTSVCILGYSGPQCCAGLWIGKSIVSSILYEATQITDGKLYIYWLRSNPRRWGLSSFVVTENSWWQTKKLFCSVKGYSFMLKENIAVSNLGSILPEKKKRIEEEERKMLKKWKKEILVRKSMNIQVSFLRSFFIFIFFCNLKSRTKFRFALEQFFFVFHNESF